MPSKDSGTNRRSVLKTTGLALAGITGISGAGSAAPGNGRGRPSHAGERGPPDHSNAPDWARPNQNRFEFATSEAEWRRARENADLPEGARSISREQMQNVVNDFNEALSEGVLELEKRADGTPVIVPGEKQGGDK